MSKHGITIFLIVGLALAAVADPGYVVGLMPATSDAPTDVRICARLGMTDLVMAPRTVSIPGLRSLATLDWGDRLWLLHNTEHHIQSISLPSNIKLISMTEQGKELWLAVGKPWCELGKLPADVEQRELTPSKRTALKPSPPLISPAQGYDDRIAYLISRLSQANLMASVNDLVDFGTRYSYYPQCRDAAAYLKSRLESYAITAEYQQYYAGYNLSAIVFTPNGTGFICGTHGLVLRKRGAVWERLDLGTTAGFNDIHFVDDNNGWVVGMDGLVYHTTNGGDSWSQVDIGSTAALLGVQFVTTSLGFICANDGSIVRTQNGGASWQTLPTGTTLPLFELFFTNSTHGWAVGSDGLIIATTDGGDSWAQQTSPTTMLLDSVWFVDDLHGWAVGNFDRTIIATVDGGVTWMRQTTPSGSEYLGGVQFLNQNLGWAVGSGGLVLRTEDGGATWLEYHTPVINDFVGVYMQNQTQGSVCGYEVSLCGTNDSGLTWADEQSTIDPNLAWLNVIGTIPGMSQQQVAASAHYDSICLNTPSTVAPGADDDATGCAALLELARLLNGVTLDKTLKLIFFSGEEQGLLGSSYYAQHAVADGDPLQVDLQADMIGYSGDDGRVFSIYDRVNNGPGTDFVSSGNLYVPGVVIWDLEIDPLAYFSDHASFWQNGIAACMETEKTPTNNPYYHKPSDLPNTLDVPFLEAGARGLVADALSSLGIAGGVPPQNLASAHPYPNPYHPLTGSLHWAGLTPSVHFRLYDLAGQEVADVWLSAPQGMADWDGKVSGDSTPAAGIYLYRLEDAAGNRMTGKLAILK